MMNSPTFFNCKESLIPHRNSKAIEYKKPNLEEKSALELKRFGGTSSVSLEATEDLDYLKEEK